MELLEEMLECRDWNEKLKIDTPASKKLSESIDEYINRRD